MVRAMASLSAVLRWLLVGSPSDAVHTLGPRGSATHALLTGYVAMELDETAVARRTSASLQRPTASSSATGTHLRHGATIPAGTPGSPVSRRTPR